MHIFSISSHRLPPERDVVKSRRERAGLNMPVILATREMVIRRIEVHS
jgi:hypothetical protein